MKFNISFVPPTWEASGLGQWGWRCWAVKSVRCPGPLLTQEPIRRPGAISARRAPWAGCGPALLWLLGPYQSLPVSIPPSCVKQPWWLLHRSLSSQPPKLERNATVFWVVDSVLGMKWRDILPYFFLFWNAFYFILLSIFSSFLNEHVKWN